MARRAGGQGHIQQQTYCDLGLRKGAGSSHSVRWALQATARSSATCVHMAIDTAWAADVLRAIGSAWAHTTKTRWMDGRQMTGCWGCVPCAEEWRSALGAWRAPAVHCHQDDHDPKAWRGHLPWTTTSGTTDGVGSSDGASAGRRADLLTRCRSTVAPIPLDSSTHLVTPRHI